jgi:hypothetical protein
MLNLEISTAHINSYVCLLQLEFLVDHLQVEAVARTDHPVHEVVPLSRSQIGSTSPGTFVDRCFAFGIVGQ